MSDHTQHVRIPELYELYFMLYYTILSFFQDAQPNYATDFSFFNILYDPSGHTTETSSDP